MKVHMEIDLQHPYGKNIEPLLSLVSIWKCDIVRIGTRKRTQLIRMPWKSFRQIWGRNPEKGNWKVPEGTGDFISGIRVTKVTG